MPYDAMEPLGSLNDDVMRKANPLDRLLQAMIRSKSPASYVLLGLAFGFWIVIWLLSGGPAAHKVVEQLWLDTGVGLAKPWTFFTYALVHVGVGTILFTALGLYFFATSLERSWGTRRFLTGFLVITTLTSVCVFLGASLFGRPFGLASMAVPVGCVIVAWATVSPSSTVLLWFVLPLKAVWIGWITFVAVVVGHTYSYPQMAVFLVIPFAVTWAHASGRLRLPMPYAAPRRRRESDYSGLDWEKRRKAEEERRRLKELFERSWREDDHQNDR